MSRGWGLGTTARLSCPLGLTFCSLSVFICRCTQLAEEKMVSCTQMSFAECPLLNVLCSTFYQLPGICSSDLSLLLGSSPGVCVTPSGLAGCSLLPWVRPTPAASASTSLRTSPEVSDPRCLDGGSIRFLPCWTEVPSDLAMGSGVWWHSPTLQCQPTLLRDHSHAMPPTIAVFSPISLGGRALRGLSC